MHRKQKSNDNKALSYAIPSYNSVIIFIDTTCLVQYSRIDEAAYMIAKLGKESFLILSFSVLILGVNLHID